MAVKKATSAAKGGVPPKKAAPAKAAATKATTRNTTKNAAKAPTKESATKVTKATVKTPAKAAVKTPVKRAVKPPAKATVKTPAKREVKPPAKLVRKAAAKTPAKVGATKVTATKATARARVTKVPRGPAPGVSTSPSAQPQRLRVRENEKPWTAKELAAVRSDLEADLERLLNEISVAELALAGLMRDVGDGAGDDPADAGTATFEREQEISLANNAREVFEQSARALARLVDGSYGICESCGSAIGKNRLLAFPRATLCMTCKSKQERR